MCRFTISSPHKIIYSSDNISKQQVLEYYEHVASVLLPFIHNRPLTTERFPHGIDKNSLTLYKKMFQTTFLDG